MISKYPHAEQALEDRHRLDALSAFTLPVHITKIEPQCGLIDRQSRSNAIKHTSHTSHPHRTGLFVSSDLDEPEIAHHQKEKNPPHKMMDVAAAHRHVVEKTDVVMNRERRCSESRQRQRRILEGQEQSFATGLRKTLLIDCSQPVIVDNNSTKVPRITATITGKTQKLR